MDDGDLRRLHALLLKYSHVPAFGAAAAAAAALAAAADVTAAGPVTVRAAPPSQEAMQGATRKRKGLTLASSVISNKKGRRSRRLNPNTPTSEMYTIVPELESLRDEWPGKKLPGEDSWITVFGDDDDASVEHWHESGFAEKAEKVLQRPVMVQFPPNVPRATCKALLEFISCFFFGLTCVYSECGVDETQFVGPTQNEYGPQCNADELIYHLEEQARQNRAWQVMVTSHDLGSDGVNFLFGLSSFDAAACVLSVSRLADVPGGMEGPAFFVQMARLISHEMGHNLGFYHCVVNECLMNGCNTLEEAMATPIELCPQCLSKLWLASECQGNLAERYEHLVGILRKMGAEKDASFLERMRDVLHGHG
jgi:predicted Zn-dependent protease